MNPQKASLLTAASLLAAVSSTTHAQLISIDFQAAGNGGQPAMALNEIAGVIPAMNWNSLPETNGDGSGSLFDSLGTPGFGNISFDGSGSYTISPGNNAPGNQKMLNGYIDTNNTVASIFSITGLPFAPTSLLTVYVYTDGDGSNGRLGTYSIGGVPSLVLNDNTNEVSFGGGFNDATSDTFGNYLVFNNVPIDSNGGFVLTATPTAGGGDPPRAPVNGIQIAVPEPTAAVLGGLGLLGLLARRRRA